MSPKVFGFASALEFWGFCFTSLVLGLLIPSLVPGTVLYSSCGSGWDTASSFLQRSCARAWSWQGTSLPEHWPLQVTRAGGRWCCLLEPFPATWPCFPSFLKEEVAPGIYGEVQVLRDIHLHLSPWLCSAFFAGR